MEAKRPDVTVRHPGGHGRGPAVLRMVWVPEGFDAALAAARRHGETPGDALVRLARLGLKQQRGE